MSQQRIISTQLSRRMWLGSSCSAFLSRAIIADDVTPQTKYPRATSGDDRSEPDWNERLTITVGHKDADLVGSTEKVIQAAVDSVARIGGGTVKVLPGIYRLRNAIALSSRVRIVGSGSDSVLIKEPSVVSTIRHDSDWFDQEITLQDDREFRVGDGICIRATNTDNNASIVLKRTLVARSGKRFKLDRPLRENIWRMGKPTASTLFPLLIGEHVSDILIDNIVLDGNKANNENLDGNHAGCIFLQDCNRITMRNVEAREYNGDGLSWQICHDCVVEDCHSHDHTGLGLHPGSGSQRSVMLRNTLERNDIGIFFCWGVRFGLAEKNRIQNNRTFGVSVGHRDTDNIIQNNEITGSGKAGIVFRPERGEGFSGDRNKIIDNKIIDSGLADGVGIDVQGYTSAIDIFGNELRETRGPEKRIGIRLGEHVGGVNIGENQIVGFSSEQVDLRTKTVRETVVSP